MEQPPPPRIPLSRPVRWSATAVLLLAFVIIPFIMFGERLEFWAMAALRTEHTAWAVAILGGTLLVTDVVLPVPSSFVLTLLGGVLGAGLGTAVGALGMSLGCGFGYALGSAVEPAAAGRLITAQEQARFARRFARHGLLVLAACRAVPVLAEASILAAGMLRLPMRSVLFTTTAANLGVAGCYAVLGASATNRSTFAVAFFASLAVPAFALAVAGLLRARGMPASRRSLEGLPLEELPEEDRHVV